MKKVLVLAAVVLGTLVANAQITFGVKAGANLATVTDLSNSESLFGFQGGGYANFAINEMFSIQPEVLYSMQGVGSNIASNDIELSYINVPVMAKYQFTEGLYGEFGPQIGFLLNAEQAGTDIKNFMNSTDFGLNIGAGYELANGLNFGARYNIGMNDVFDVTPSVDGKNSVISAGVGYTFK